jgi:hypothetical protein
MVSTIVSAAAHCALGAAFSAWIAVAAGLSLDMTICPPKDIAVGAGTPRIIRPIASEYWPAQ